MRDTCVQSLRFNICASMKLVAVSAEYFSPLPFFSLAFFFLVAVNLQWPFLASAYRQVFYMQVGKHGWKTLELNI